MNSFLPLESLISHSIVERLGWVLVHSLWQFALVALTAGVIVRVMRRNSAGMRYFVLVAAMAVSVAAPASTWLLLPSDVVAPAANQAEYVAPESSSTAAIDPESNVTRSASDGTLASEGEIGRAHV